MGPSALGCYWPPGVVVDLTLLLCCTVMTVSVLSCLYEHFMFFNTTPGHFMQPSTWTGNPVAHSLYDLFPSATPEVLGGPGELSRCAIFWELAVSSGV